MSEEGYKPTEGEMAQAEGMMHGYQKELSEKRENLANEADMELMKKCQIRYVNRGNGQEFVEGTVDGEKIHISYFPQTGRAGGDLNGIILDDEMALALWKKFAPIGKLIMQSEKIEEDAKEKLKLTASRLLDL